MLSYISLLVQFSLLVNDPFFQISCFRLLILTTWSRGKRRESVLLPAFISLRASSVRSSGDTICGEMWIVLECEMCMVLILCDVIDDRGVCLRRLCECCVMKWRLIIWVFTCSQRKWVSPAVWLSPGGYSKKEVHQTLSLSVNSELTYSEMENTEYPVPI